MRFARTFLLMIASLAFLRAQGDAVMNAMRDEMTRSMKQLTVENLEKAYFISYRVVDSDTAFASASFGAVNGSGTNRLRRLTVEVRVGDYKLDNSHFFTFSTDPGALQQIQTGATSLPPEDNYKELRRQLWLTTDAVYKKAVEDLAKKRALFETRRRDDETDDYTREDPVVANEDMPPVIVDLSALETRARSLSSLFRQMPGIDTSSVQWNRLNTYTRFLTSEGASYTRHQSSVTFNANAATQAPDGSPLDDFIWFHGRSLAEIPSDQELTSQLHTMGRQLTELRGAPTLANYNGPVLAEGDAAAQLVRLAFLPSLIGTKPTLSGLPGALPNVNQSENPFLDKIGARVLPDFLSVIDDPTISQYRQHPMAGFSKVDEDGMRPREVTLVENGILKTLLMSRNPVRGIDHSTGSQHAGETSPSNVIVKVSNGLSQADLRAKFLDLIKRRNLPFGIAVRRMRNVSNTLLAYKVFPDGHEELVRSIQFFGLNAAAFKDIVAASSEPNYLTVRYDPPRTTPFAMLNLGEETFTPVSLVVPSVLFEDVSVRRIRAEAPNPPVSGHPFFDKQ
jgi:hypothetical protein